MRKVLAAELHGIHVTEADLYYRGSITLDPDYCQEAGNSSDGIREDPQQEFRSAHLDLCYFRRRRFALLRPQCSCCARLPGGRRNHRLQLYLCERNANRPARPGILTFDRNNHVIDRLTYFVTRDDAEGYDFEILGSSGDFNPYRFELQKRIEQTSETLDLT